MKDIWQSDDVAWTREILRRWERLNKIREAVKDREKNISSLDVIKLMNKVMFSVYVDAKEQGFELKVLP